MPRQITRLSHPWQNESVTFRQLMIAGKTIVDPLQNTSNGKVLEFFFEGVLCALFFLNLFFLHLNVWNGGIYDWTIIFLPALWIAILSRKNAIAVIVVLLRRISFGNLLLLGGIVLLLVASSLLSVNSDYGVRKAVAMIVGALPLALALAYLLETFDPRRLVVTITLVTGTGIGLFVLAISRWPGVFRVPGDFFGFAHVGFGIFVGFSSIVSFAASNTLKPRWRLVMIVAVFLLLAGTMMSRLAAGLGGALLGVIAVGALRIRQQPRQTWQVLIIIAALCMFVALLLRSDFMRGPLSRYELITRISSDPNTVDAATHGRSVGYIAAVKMIADAPWFGRGLGGFNSSFDGDQHVWLRYPHNIFLETWVELGFVGFVALVAMVILTIKRLVKSNGLVLVLYLYFLWLAQFSGDLPSQKIVLVGMVLLIFDSDQWQKWFSPNRPRNDSLSPVET